MTTARTGYCHPCAWYVKKELHGSLSFLFLCCNSITLPTLICLFHTCRQRKRCSRRSQVTTTCPSRDWISSASAQLSTHLALTTLSSRKRGYCPALPTHFLPQKLNAIPLTQVATVQAISGTGALRVGAEYLSRFLPSAYKGAQVYLPDPSYVNHTPIFKLSGFTLNKYRYYDPNTCGLDFKGLIEDVKVKLTLQPNLSNLSSMLVSKSNVGAECP